MAKIEEYRQHIKELLVAYSQYTKSNSEVEAQTIFDAENNHYSHNSQQDLNLLKILPIL